MMQMMSDNAVLLNYFLNKTHSIPSQLKPWRSLCVVDAV